MADALVGIGLTVLAALCLAVQSLRRIAVSVPNRPHDCVRSTVQTLPVATIAL